MPVLRLVFLALLAALAAFPALAQDPGAVAAEGGPGGGLAVSVYPNPAASRATVSVALEAPAEVRVAVYDVLGRRVVVLHDGLLTGPVELSVDVSTLAPGAYVVRITGAGATAARTVSVVR